MDSRSTDWAQGGAAIAPGRDFPEEHAVEQASLPGGWTALPGVEEYVIGVEIGGRGQRVALADGGGRVLGQAQSIDAGAPAPSVVETVKSLVGQACRAAQISLDRVTRLGVAFGGPVDRARGVTLLSHRAAGFENFPLVNVIEDALGVPIVLENDARAAALGETMYGAGRGSQDVVYVHLGTGVGSGIIADGRLLHGAGGTAGEIGHMVVSIGGPICSCGKPGHLEAYASGPAIVSRMRQRVASGTSEEQRAWADRAAPSVRAVFEQAQVGDPVASDVVTETVQVLGMAIANLITVLNPATVIVGGSVAEVGPLLMDPLGSHVRRYSYPAAARRVRLSLAQFRGDSALLGAVALALLGERS